MLGVSVSRIDRVVVNGMERVFVAEVSFVPDVLMVSEAEFVTLVDMDIVPSPERDSVMTGVRERVWPFLDAVSVGLRVMIRLLESVAVAVIRCVAVRSLRLLFVTETLGDVVTETVPERVALMSSVVLPDHVSEMEGVFVGFMTREMEGENVMDLADPVTSLENVGDGEWLGVNLERVRESTIDFDCDAL